MPVVVRVDCCMKFIFIYIIILNQFWPETCLLACIISTFNIFCYMDIIQYYKYPIIIIFSDTRKNIVGLTFNLFLILVLNMYKKLAIQFFSIFTE